jgi:hypothetical protein
VTRAVSARIEAVLAGATHALTIKEIAAEIGLDPDAVAQAIWDSPNRFSWQPGGRWILAAPKQSVRPPAVASEHDDTRPSLLSSQDGVELRAMTLASGATLRVSRRPLDTSAAFSVRATGRDLQLILNSSHEIFEDLPMPFDDEAGDGAYKRLVELLLTAWAVHEAETPPGASKRALEDARLMWGRSLLDLIDVEP